VGCLEFFRNIEGEFARFFGVLLGNALQKHEEEETEKFGSVQPKIKQRFFLINQDLEPKNF